MVDLLTFFKDTYETVFNFKTGPPVHDACAIAFVSRCVQAVRWSPFPHGRPPSATFAAPLLRLC